MLTQKLDEHIEAVKQQIAEAEKLREDAAADLKKAQEKEGEIEEIITANRLKSEEKIRRLREENERLLKMLRERHEISLKTQLEAEVVKQKNQLIDRLADLILKKISGRIEETDYKFSISLKNEDLNKLLESNSKTIH